MRDDSDISLLDLICSWAQGCLALRQICMVSLLSGSRTLDPGHRSLGHLSWERPSQTSPPCLFLSLRYSSLFFFIVLTMGNTQLTPSKDSPLEYLLKNLQALGLTDLKPKHWILYCNMAWLQYKLGDQEVWPMDSTVNYNTILQLDLYCCHSKKWSEVPHVQAFFKLFHHPNLHSSCLMLLLISTSLPTPSFQDSYDLSLPDLPPPYPPSCDPSTSLSPLFPTCPPQISLPAPLSDWVSPIHTC